jgi:DNA/RNA endonuclease YhcR with UshA esterase domain
MQTVFAANRAGRLVLLSAALVLLVAPADAATVSPDDTAGHVGETATVCGVVASAEFSAASRSQPTFLDMERPYPNLPFTAVIFGDNRAKFGAAETTLRGKRVCVTGQIRDYRGRPEVILHDPRQLSE